MKKTRCPNCGTITEIDDSTIGTDAKCGECGYDPSRGSVDKPVSPEQNTPGFDTIGAATDLFRLFFVIYLFAVVIGHAIAGYYIGEPMNSYSSNYYHIIGLVIGLALGVFVAVIQNGLVSTFLNIDKNIQKIAAKMDAN